MAAAADIKSLVQAKKNQNFGNNKDAPTAIDCVFRDRLITGIRSFVRYFQTADIKYQINGNKSWSR